VEKASGKAATLLNSGKCALFFFCFCAIIAVNNTEMLGEKMETREMNRRAARILEEWDPFAIGTELYGTEIVDVISALQLLDDPSDLAKKIQSVYEFSFEKWIPLERCVEISYKLLALKFEAKFII
jgi:hypothetical protein